MLMLMKLLFLLLLTSSRWLIEKHTTASDSLDIVPINLTLIVIKLLLRDNGLLLES